MIYYWKQWYVFTSACYSIYTNFDMYMNSKHFKYTIYICMCAPVSLRTDWRWRIVKYHSSYTTMQFGFTLTASDLAVLAGHYILRFINELVNSNITYQYVKITFFLIIFAILHTKKVWETYKINTNKNLLHVPVHNYHQFTILWHAHT